MVNSKYPFLQALFTTVLVFAIGILVGVYFENSKSNEINNLAINSELSLLDTQVMSEISGNFNVSCDLSRQSLVVFANKIYSEAVLLEKYDSSNQLTDMTYSLHKKYDILRLILWKEVVKHNNRCDDKLNYIVYIYQYKKPSPEIASMQGAFSRYISDQKGKLGDQFILIPIGGDTGSSAIDLTRLSFGVNSFPAVIVNGNNVIFDLEGLKNLDNLLLND